MYGPSYIPEEFYSLPQWTPEQQYFLSCSFNQDNPVQYAQHLTYTSDSALVQSHHERLTKALNQPIKRKRASRPKVRTGEYRSCPLPFHTSDQVNWHLDWQVAKLARWVATRDIGGYFCTYTGRIWSTFMALNYRSFSRRLQCWHKLESLAPLKSILCLAFVLTIDSSLIQWLP